MQVSGSQDKTVALWDLEAGKQVQAFVGHTHFVEGAWVPTALCGCESLICCTLHVYHMSRCVV
jgi:hypothetical protein